MLSNFSTSNSISDQMCISNARTIRQFVPVIKKVILPFPYTFRIDYFKFYFSTQNLKNKYFFVVINLSMIPYVYYILFMILSGFIF